MRLPAGCSASTATLSSRCIFPLLGLLLVSMLGRALAATAETQPAYASSELAATVQDIAVRIGVDKTVNVKIVEDNRLAFSVEPDGANFLLSVDVHFLNGLSREEVAAAVAHEMGHVWIYTHHPFLHTEALANDIAMRAVPRESLKQLYLKLWKFEGLAAGNLDSLLGPESPRTPRAAVPASAQK